MSKKTSLRKLKSQTRPRKSFTDSYMDRLVKNLQNYNSFQKEQKESVDNLFSDEVQKNTSAFK